jgi:hypothetical protein
MNIIIARFDINIEMLDAELRATLGEQCSGISTDPHGVIVHLTDDATQTQIDQARQIVIAHDVSVQTSEQIATKQRRDEIAKLAGKALDKLTLPEIKTVLALQWREAGIIDDAGNITVPDKWHTNVNFPALP